MKHSVYMFQKLQIHHFGIKPNVLTQIWDKMVFLINLNMGGLYSCTKLNIFFVLYIISENL